MTDLSPFERAISNGLQTTRYFMGVPIVYTRGGTSLTISRALQGTTHKRSIEVGETEQVVQFQQWHIGVLDLSPLGPPERGDLITRVIDNVTHVFSVEAIALGETEWDWSDVAKTQYIINTRKSGDSAFEVSEPTGFDLSGNPLLP